MGNFYFVNGRLLMRHALADVTLLVHWQWQVVAPFVSYRHIHVAVIIHHSLV